MDRLQFLTPAGLEKLRRELREGDEDVAAGHLVSLEAVIEDIQTISRAAEEERRPKAEDAA